MSMSMITGRKSGGRSATSEAVLVDSFTKGSALRRAKIAAVVALIVVTGLVFVVANAFSASSKAALVAALAGIGVGVLTFVMIWAWPVLRIAWHWAGEFVLVALLAGLYVPVAMAAGGLVAGLVLMALVGLPFAFGPSRRFVIAWGMCMVMRHRLRVACDAFVEGKGVHGAVKPFILLARPTPAGERIWIWLRGSLTLADVQQRTGPMASVCWAKRAVAESAGSKAAYARIDLFRRDPLAETITSPLVELLHDVMGRTKNDDTLTLDGSEPAALNLDDISDADVEQVPVSFGKQKSRSTQDRPGGDRKKKDAQSATVDADGEDISDWI